LQSSVMHSVVIIIEEGRSIPADVLQDLKKKKKASVDRLLPQFHLPQMTADQGNQPSGAMAATGAQCLSDSQVKSYRNEVITALQEYCAELINAGLLGFVISRDSEPAYSYVLRTAKISPDSVKHHPTDVKYDTSAPQGSRTIYTDVIEARGKACHTTAEHAHYLADARTVPLSGFIKPLPQRVRELEADMPAWLKHYVTVMEGTIIREEVHEREDEAYETKWQSVVKRVYKASPAFTLGDLVLAGWSNDDFKLDENTKRASQGEGPGIGGIVCGIAALGLLIWACPAAAAWIGRKALFKI